MMNSAFKILVTNGSALMMGLALTLSAYAVEVNGLAENCQKCHGEDGNSTDPKVASIAGFSSVVISDALHQFKDGDRDAVRYTPEGGEETDMLAVANDLSDEEIEAIARFLSKQIFKPAKQEFDAKLAKKGGKKHKKNCEKCHSDNGTNADDDAAILAGQWRDYLTYQFDLIVKKQRDIPRKMAKRFNKLDENDVKALIEFYVSQQ